MPLGADFRSSLAAHFGAAGNSDIDCAADNHISNENYRYDSSSRYSKQSCSQLMNIFIGPKPKPIRDDAKNMKTPQRKRQQGFGEGVSKNIELESEKLAEKISKINEATEVKDSAENVHAEMDESQFMEELTNLSKKVKTLTAERMTTPLVELENGHEHEDFIQECETKYFRLPFHGEGDGFKVLLRAIEGDPDLYVSQSNTKPNQNGHTWRSASEGVDCVHVPPKAPKFRHGVDVFIGVHGHSRSHFKIKAFWIIQQTSPDSAEGGLATKTFRKATAMRVAEKISSYRERQAQLNDSSSKRTNFIASSNEMPANRGEAVYGRFGRTYSVKERLRLDLSKLRRKVPISQKKRFLSHGTIRENASSNEAASERTGWVGIGDFILPGLKTKGLADPNQSIGNPTNIPIIRDQGSRKRTQHHICRPKWESPKIANRSSLRLMRELQASKRRSERHIRQLSTTFQKYNGNAVDELGGLALEVPIRTRDERTRSDLAKKLDRDPSLRNTFKIGTLGISEQEMNLERQCLSKSVRKVT